MLLLAALFLVVGVLQVVAGLTLITRGPLRRPRHVDPMVYGRAMGPGFVLSGAGVIAMGAAFGSLLPADISSRVVFAVAAGAAVLVLEAAAVWMWINGSRALRRSSAAEAGPPTAPS